MKWYAYLWIAIAASIAIYAIAGVSHCTAWGCYGGPCVTSAACVEGCHCMGDPGRCG